MDTNIDPGNISPTTTTERIATIDILRGFAIFGILVVNMMLFGHPIFTATMGLVDWPHWADRVVEWGIRFFAESKFYSIFSMLFGLGLVIQMTRAEARQVRFVPMFIRRMLVLLVFGLIHAYLFWVGDILTIYALLGFVLLLFRKARPRTLLIWVVISALIPVLISAGGAGLMALARSSPEGVQMIETTLAEQDRAYHANAAKSLEVYTQGDFAAQVARRVSENLFMYGIMPFFATSVFAMLLLGLYLGKRGVFQDIAGNLPLIRAVRTWGLIIGVPANLVYVVTREFSVRSHPSGITALADFSLAVGAPALSLFYMSAITLLVQNPQWKQRLSPLAAVGRMALTNYLLQTLICTTIFYNYGLGFYGQIMPAAGLALTIAVYLVQIPLSVWWLKHYRFGPMEWLWRSLTYLRFQPMRIERAGTRTVRQAG